MAKITWLIHNYPPYQNAGAEWMAVEINNYLKCQGHEVRVISFAATEDYYFQDILVMAPFHVEQIIAQSDILLTHLDRTDYAIEMADRYKKPLGHVIHHNFEIPQLRRNLIRNFLIYNTEWIKKDRAYKYASVVVNPPVDISRFEGFKYNKKGAITLVNVNAHKGGYILQSLAKGMPGHKFLGVKGFHGHQIYGENTRNLRYIDGVEDIREVFAETAILIVPSVYESYGRIAIEAAACGIPVIANNTPGLKEAIGDAAIYASRKDLTEWIAAIHQVKPGKHLKERAAAQWAKSQTQLSELNKLLLSVL